MVFLEIPNVLKGTVFRREGHIYSLTKLFRTSGIQSWDLQFSQWIAIYGYCNLLTHEIFLGYI